MPPTGERLLALRQALDRAEEARLSPLACPSRAAVRRRPDPSVDTGHRQEFAVDADRVLHSLAYTRYIDKTQVFSLVPNDHITHRVLHVQLVSKIARGMGRLLGLNEDLIEAMALAHDIGHPPFGHDGERFLSEKCREHGLGPFLHNVQSVRALERLEHHGQGLNLTLQVLDGVLCHDGEVHTARLIPNRAKTFADLDAEMAAKVRDPKLPLIPLTLEGCLVRMADTVAYVGRDLEDAVLLGLVAREDLPETVRRVLGETNGTIVYRLVEDLIANSLEGDEVAFSPEVGAALGRLKEFNLHRIYLNPRIKTEHGKIREAYHRLFERFLADLRERRTASPIYRDFLAGLAPDYRAATPPAGQVRDFLAGMTDQFFLNCYQELVWPRRLPSRLTPLDDPNA
ncbi:MAG: HD domain-containing protein [Deltaproteobacteria bacterium]|nr:HD domain-containing protein [Deltaproteobacteria bacterium]